MTYQSKYRENKRLIEGYAAYLDECRTLDEKIKLSAEIGRLLAENKTIETMGVKEQQDECPGIDHHIKSAL